MRNVNSIQKICNLSSHVFILLIGVLNVVSAQNVAVTGADAVTNGLSPFATLAAAFTSINGAVQTGNTITITIINDTSEPVGGAILNAGVWTSISIQPSGGATRTISGAIAGHLIDLNGADNVTIDGLNTGSNALIIDNTTSGATSSTIRFIGDASNNTIQNCTIKGATTSATLGTVFFSTGSATGNDGNNINNCTINSSGANFATNAVYSLGTSAVIDNSGNTLNANNISDYFIATGSASIGILLGATGNSAWTITNNKLFQTATRIFTSTQAGLCGISIQTGSGYTITGNIIGFANTAGTGTTNIVGNTVALTGFPGSYTTTGTANATRYVAINCAFTAAGAVSSIQNNTIAGFALYTSSNAATTTGIFCGIAVTAGNADIGTTTGNTIGSTSGNGSIYTACTSTGGMIAGIYATSSNTIAIQNNTIGALDAMGTTATISGGINGIGIAGSGSFTVIANTIGNSTNPNMRMGNLTTTGNLSNVGSTFGIASGTGAFKGILATSTGPTKLVGTASFPNNIRNASLNSSSASSSFRGIEISGAAGVPFVSGNSITNITSTSTNVSITSGGVAGIGIYVVSGAAGSTLAGNLINSLALTNTTTNGTNLAGISTAATTVTISKNLIYGLSNASTSTTVTTPGTASGILIRSGVALAAINVSNNMISLGVGETSNTSFIGIWGQHGSTPDPITNIYFNSINIEGAASSGAQPSFCYSRGDFSITARTATVDIRNNIFTNTRSGGTGKHYAIANNYGATASATGWGANATNYNVLNGTATNIGYWTTDRTFSAWKTASTSDANSYSGITVTFLASATGDLHLNMGATPTILESHGVTGLGISDDVDGQTRPGGGVTNGGGTAPDLGADEFDGTPIDDIAPTISYTILSNTTSTTNRTTSSFATITDLSGINTTLGTRPRIYYKLSTDVNNTFNDNTSSTVGWKYAEAIGTTSPFDFTIDYSILFGAPAITIGDNIQYFVVAQDNAGTPNVGINSGTFVAAPANVDLSGAFPIGGAINSYVISASYNGSYNVGSGQTYTTLTGAGGFFASINGGVLTGNITVNVVSALTEDGTNALNQWFEEGVGGYTMTIQPDAATERLISGAVANGMIRLNGADRVTFDGRFSGSGAYLRIRNTNTSNPAITFLNDATNDTIRYSIVESANTSTTSGTILFSTSTGILGNSNNTINNCDIRDRSDAAGVPANAVYSSGSAGGPNATNTVSGCNVFNFTNSGVLVSATGAGNGWTVNPSSFYQTASRTTAIVVISIQGGSGHSILSNSIGGAAADRSGAPMATTSTFSAISLGVGTTTPTSVQGNTISNLNISGGSIQVWQGINISSGNVNVGTVTGNIIGGGAMPYDTIRTNYDSRAIYNTGAGTINIENNIIGNISYYRVSGDELKGIRVNAGTNTIRKNIVRDLKSNSIASTTFFLSGIHFAAATANNMVDSNQVYNLTQNNAAGGAIFNVGIFVGSLTSGEVKKNKIYNINAELSSLLYGIYSLSGSATYSNNMIALNPSTANHLIGGIRDEGTGTNNWYYNTVCIQGTNGGGAVNTYAFLRNGIATLDIKNNIFANERTGGSGFHVAIANINAAATGWPSTASDYNNLYNAVPTNLAQWLGSAAINNLDFVGWKAAQSGGSGGDANSQNVLPVFLTATDLHLYTFANNSINNAGIPIAGILTDFDDNIRNGSTPDIGADEFAPIPCTGAIAGTADATPAAPFCNSGATTISATGYSIGIGSTYQWQSSADVGFTTPVNLGSPSVSYANLNAGTITSTTYYRLKVTCNTGIAEDFTAVPVQVVINLSLANISGLSQKCPADPAITLTENGGTGTSWLWSTSETSSIISVNPVSTTTYTVTVTSPGSCMTTSTKTIIVLPVPSMPLASSNMPVCEGNTLNLTSSATIAEDVSNYSFASSSGTYTPISGGTVLASSDWDDGPAGIGIPLGFTFRYNGVDYTTCNINLNGFISFGTTTSVSNYTPISTLTTNEVGTIAAFGRDIMGVISTGEIQYLSSGGVFTVQWSNARRYHTSANAESFNFQIQLHQITNEVKMVYGSFSDAISSFTPALPQVGLRGTTTADFKNVEVLNTGSWASPTNGTTNTATSYYNEATVGGKPTSGQTYTFTPPVLTYAWTGPNTFSSGLQNPTINSITPAASGTYNVTMTNPVTSCTNTALTVVIVNSEANYVYHEQTVNNPGCGPNYMSTTTPNNATQLTLSWEVEYQFYTDEVRVYYTTDGSTPSGAFGVGSGTTQVVSGSYNCTFGSPLVAVVTAAIPALPAGTTIKYIVSAWNSCGGDEVFGNGPSAQCFCGAPTNNSSLAIVFMYTVSASNPVEVTSSGGTAYASYVTLGAAFTAINAGTHTGTITIKIVGNTTETASAVLNASGVGSASYTTMSIQPFGGTPRTISGAIVAGSPLIDFIGADNVTINGLNSGGNSLTISNITVSATTGTSTIRFIDGATNNTITNCYVQGSGTMAVATNGAVIFFSTDAVTAGGNDNNTISNCDIGPSGANLPTKGILGNGSTTSTAIGNSGIIITNNDIHDFFGVAVTSAGVAINGGSNTWTITNNRFYQTGTRTWTTGALHTPVILNSSTSISGVQGMSITGNIIGYASNTQTGTYTLTGSFGRFNGISFSGIQAGTISNINNNTVASVSLTGVTSQGTTNISPFTGMSINSGPVNVNNNTIGSQSETGSLTFSTNTSSPTDVQGIYLSTSTIAEFNSNSIGGLTANNVATSGAYVVYGIRSYQGFVTWTGTSNTIGGTIANSIQNNCTSTSAQLIGMATTLYSNASLTSNVIRNLTSATALVVGIRMVPPLNSEGHIISQNTISNLTNTNTNAQSIVGIDFSGGSENIVESNFIHSLFSATTSTLAGITGIRAGSGTTIYRNNMIAIGEGVVNAIGEAANNSTVTGLIGINNVDGTNSFFHNTVYLGGTATAGSGGSYSLNGVEMVEPRSFRDNIFVNSRTNSGATGKHYAVKMNGTTPNPSGLTINNNIYFVNGASGAVFGFFNSSDVADFATWKTAVGQDINSIEGNPQLQDPSNAIPDLHINPSITSVAEGNGADVSVTFDFDGQTRSGLTPVDIGADAGNFMGVDLLAPFITYTSLAFTCSGADRILTTSISDVSGVPTFGTLQPRIYYRKNADAWFSSQGILTAGTGISGTWDFTIVSADMGGVANPDVISYYVIAQDIAGTPNIGTNPSAGLVATNVNAVGAPPTTPNTYIIQNTMSGIYTVGTAGTFPTLSAAVNVYNISCLTGPVIFQLDDANYTTPNETFPIIINANPYASSSNTLTIRPATLNTATVTGSVSFGAIMKILGNYVTIDGSNNATSSRDLTFTNSSGLTPNVIWIASTGATSVTNVTLKNSILINGINSSGSALLLGDGASTSSSGNFNNITIQNNSVQKSSIGISAKANVTPGNGSGLNIVSNDLSTAGANAIRRGLYVAGVDGATVQNNNIGNISFDDNCYGIWFDTGTKNSLIEKNTIHDIKYTGFSLQGCKGIMISTGLAEANIIVKNNMVSGITGRGDDYFFSGASSSPVGIYAYGIEQGGVHIYYNTIHLSGSTLNESGSYSFGIALDETSSANVKNNIIYNQLGKQSPGGPGVGGVAIGAETSASQFTTLSNNNYYTSVPFGSNFIGKIAANNYATLVAWQSVTGSDVNSFNVLPVFTSVTDLHLTSANPELDNAGTPIVDITNDIDNDTRNVSMPDIGADEFKSCATVTSNADAGLGSLRAAIACVPENGKVYYDQPATATTVLTTLLTIDKNVTIFGVGPLDRPEITTDPATGISIDALKTLTLKDIDLKSTAPIQTIFGTGALSITGTTVGKQ